MDYTVLITERKNTRPSILYSRKIPWIAAWIPRAIPPALRAPRNFSGVTRLGTSNHAHWRQREDEAEPRRQCVPRQGPGTRIRRDISKAAPVAWPCTAMSWPQEEERWVTPAAQPNLQELHRKRDNSTLVISCCLWRFQEFRASAGLLPQSAPLLYVGREPADTGPGAAVPAAISFTGEIVMKAVSITAIGRPLEDRETPLPICRRGRSAGPGQGGRYLSFRCALPERHFTGAASAPDPGPRGRGGDRAGRARGGQRQEGRPGLPSLSGHLRKMRLLRFRRRTVLSPGSHAGAAP